MKSLILGYLCLFFGFIAIVALMGGDKFLTNLWKRVKYHLGFVSIIKQGGYYYITRRKRGRREYLHNDEIPLNSINCWWFSPVQKYTRYNSLAEAQEHLERYNVQVY